MACYEPKNAWEVKGIQTEEGKKVIVFNIDNVWKDTELIKIPCGSCIGCRLDYSRMWMARIVKEAEGYKNNAFITLTYNEENIPYKDVINKETGELITGHPLIKSHLRDFIKRLRRQYEYHFNHKGIRFYACGEYGSKNQRPHYHIAAFNIDTTVWGDIKQIGSNHQGDAIWTSEKIEKIWGKGFITIGDLTPQSAAYIARYMLKKQKGEKKTWYYESQGIISEYTSSSLKPGISKQWYEKHKETYWLTDKLYIPKRNSKPQTVRTPAYFDRQLDKENPEKLKEIKEHRKQAAEKARRLKQSKTTLSEEDQLKTEKENKEASAKKLIRCIE